LTLLVTSRIITPVLSSIEDEIDLSSMVAWVGPLATINREPGQAWKGAATAVASCAGMWLAWAAAFKCPFFILKISNIFTFVAILDSEN